MNTPPIPSTQKLECAALFTMPTAGLDDAARAALRAFRQRAASLQWERTTINAAIKDVMGELKLKMPQVAVPLRVAVTGRTQTPAIDAVLEVFGRDTTLARIDRALS